uniref:Uncharacterized protein n=1 Tax=Anguilla anguilla TaxID=7936 RepID=A0A0E9W1B2_ANGAN
MILLFSANFKLRSSLLRQTLL